MNPAPAEWGRIGSGDVIHTMLGDRSLCGIAAGRRRYRKVADEPPHNSLVCSKCKTVARRDGRLELLHPAYHGGEEGTTMGTNGSSSTYQNEVRSALDTLVGNSNSTRSELGALMDLFEKEMERRDKKIHKRLAELRTWLEASLSELHEAVAAVEVSARIFTPAEAPTEALTPRERVTEGQLAVYGEAYDLLHELGAEEACKALMSNALYSVSYKKVPAVSQIDAFLAGDNTSTWVTPQRLAIITHALKAG